MVVRFFIGISRKASTYLKGLDFVKYVEALREIPIKNRTTSALYPYARFR